MIADIMVILRLHVVSVVLLTDPPLYIIVIPGLVVSPDGQRVAIRASHTQIDKYFTFLPGFTELDCADARIRIFSTMADSLSGYVMTACLDLSF
jgi:hypothetical protein